MSVILNPFTNELIDLPSRVSDLQSKKDVFIIPPNFSGDLNLTSIPINHSLIIDRNGQVLEENFDYFLNQDKVSFANDIHLKGGERIKAFYLTYVIN